MKLRLGLGLSLASSTIHALSSLPSRASNKLIPRLSRGFNSATFLTKGMGMGLVGLTLFAAAGPAAAHSEGSETEEGSSIDPFAHTKLYPLPPLLEEGTLKVNSIHTIAYSVYGNPTGKEVLFVHGGPGGGTDKNMARYFDPKIYKIILVDQRGCGKSTPFANLEDNTTWDLVADFEKIREKLGIKKWQVFGGSWGSTLGLSYAVTHPERVTELVLRGIFLLRKKELDFFYEGKGSNFIFPDAWEEYENAIPEHERGNYIAAYGKRLRGEMGDDEMKKAAKAWSIWEGSVSKLRPPTAAQVKSRFGADKFSLAFARIENHYFSNRGFFKEDGWLLKKEQLDKIKDIPTVIVQGRYDVVCPATSAYELHKLLPKSELYLTTTGHSGFEDEIIERLVESTDKFAKL